MDTRIFDQVPLFDSLSQGERDVLSRHFVLRRYPKHSVVINEGDDSQSLYIILSGRVKVYLSDANGKEVILNIQQAGEYFGEISLMDDGPRSASVMTEEACQFAVLMKQEFLSCISENPNVALNIIRGLTKRLRSLSENVRNLALVDVYGRVSSLLTELAVERDGMQVIEGKLTQNDITAQIGASPKIIKRIMVDLKGSGYVSKSAIGLVLNKPLPGVW